MFCNVTDRSTESTVLAGLLCTQQTTFTEISIFSQHLLSRSLFSLPQPLCLKLYAVQDFVFVKIFLKVSSKSGQFLVLKIGPCRRKKPRSSAPGNSSTKKTFSPGKFGV
jgi:hypothetical protein